MYSPVTAGVSTASVAGSVAATGSSFLTSGFASSFLPLKKPMMLLGAPRDLERLLLVFLLSSTVSAGVSASTLFFVVASVALAALTGAMTAATGSTKRKKCGLVFRDA
jgi:hypothetical protein